MDETRVQRSSAPSPGATITKRYAGKYADATAEYEWSRQALAKEYWFPVSQTYVPGQWGCGAWALAFVLLVFVIGIIVLAYMIAVKPGGELVVVYEYRPPVQPSPTAEVHAPTPNPVDTLQKLADLRDRGLLTPDEFETKKAEILARM